jgi:CHAD domain-containing protein
MSTGTGGFVEVERTFDVEVDAQLPDLATGQVAALGETVVLETSATYHDTAGLALLRAGITMRRREGGDDDGWHIKVNAGNGARLELHRPLGKSAKPPAAVRRLLNGVVRGDELAPVVQLATVRTQTPLLADDGGVLAVLCDDRVSAELPAAAADQEPTRQDWREIELELVDGDRRLLDAMTEQLAAAGISPAPVQSKLKRALGNPSFTTAGEAGSVGAALLDALELQRTALLRADVRVRAQEPDSVHQLRVAARTSRSLLAGYRPFLAVPAIEAELKQLGQALAPARDLEIIDDQVESLLADETPGPALSAARTMLRTASQRLHRVATADVSATLDSDSYLQLLDDFTALVDSAPLTASAAKPAVKQVSRRTGKAYRRLEGRMHASEPLTGDERNAALHEARKAVKRLRYLLEMAEPHIGAPARRLRRHSKQLQQVLGAHQDVVVLRHHLAATVADSASASKPAAVFVLGRLDAHLERQAAALEQQAGKAWRRTSAKRGTSWLR